MEVILPSGKRESFSKEFVLRELSGRGMKLDLADKVFEKVKFQIDEEGVTEISWDQFSAFVGNSILDIPIMTDPKPPQFGQLTVLVIGNSDYNPTGVSHNDLPGVNQDEAGWRRIIPAISSAQQYACLEFQVIEDQTGAAMRTAITGLLDPVLKTCATQWKPSGASELQDDSLFIRDTRLLVYSGHGGGVKDVSGDEATGIDAALLGVNVRAARRDPNVGTLFQPGGCVIDDFVSGLAASVTSLASLYFVYDSCYSGASSRAPIGDPTPPQFIPRPRTLADFRPLRNADFGLDRSTAGKGTWLEAAKWNETAKETTFGGGAFTSSLLGTLQSSIFATPETLKTIAVAATGHYATSRLGPQTPQLEDLDGLGDRPFLEGRKWI